MIKLPWSKRKTEELTATELPKCALQGEGGECSAVALLRELQKQLEFWDERERQLNRSEPILLNLIQFLKPLAFTLEFSSRTSKNYDNEYTLCIARESLKSIDYDELIKELELLHSDTLSRDNINKQKAELAQQIKEVKDSLGIK